MSFSSSRRSSVRHAHLIHQRLMRWLPSPKSLGFALWLVLMFAAETAAWFTLVPEKILLWTFIQINCLLILMFATGLASAMNGRAEPSVTQILNDIERPAGRRKAAGL